MGAESSVGSSWLLDYYKEQGHAFKRGLRSLDPRQANECSLCVACDKVAELPGSPVGRSQEQKRLNLEYIARELKALGATPRPENAVRVSRKADGSALNSSSVARSRYQNYVLARPSV